MSLRFLSIVSLFALASCLNRPQPASGSHNPDPLQGTKPNIVYINVDDLGWMDTSVYGSTFYETPNIDRLAKMGMTFTNGYAGAANCAPSRACLLSGQNTPRHGIYTVGNSDRGHKKSRKLIPIPNTKILADSIITIAEMLKSAGYASGSFGKWHLGEDPRTQGFDVNVGGEHRGNPGKKGYFSPYNLKDLKDAPIGENLTDRLTTEAINFMKGNKQNPFFVYLPYYAVHTPLETTDLLKEKYESLGNPFQNNATYAGMVETVDKNIGAILDYLENAQLLENTLVVFTSDNGGIRDISNQDPLRAGKGSYYEGGIRVPFIMAWKGKITPKSKNRTPISNLDFYPTFMELSNSQMTNDILDGQSLLPLFSEKELPDRDLFFHFPIYLQAYNVKTDDGRDPLFRTRPGSVLISGKWKLHQYFEDNGLELYNLEEDMGEEHNLAKIYPDISKRLLNKMEVVRNAMNAPVPQELNPTYDPKWSKKEK